MLLTLHRHNIIIVIKTMLCTPRTLIFLGLTAYSTVILADSSLMLAQSRPVQQASAMPTQDTKGKRENLFQIYLLAHKNNADLRAAEARYQSARMQTGVTRSELFPDITYEYNLTETQQRLFGESNLARLKSQDRYTSKRNLLKISQNLYRHDLWVALESANTNEARALAQREAVRQRLIIRLAQAYFDILAAQDLQRSSMQEKTAIALQLKQAKARFEVGLADIVQVKETQASYDLAAAREIEAHNLLEDRLAALALITGHPHRLLAALSENLTPVLPEPADIEQWADTALKHNLEHLINRREFELAEHSVEYERSKHWPSLELNANWTDSKDTGGLVSNGRGSRTNSEQIGLLLTVPLFRGGETYYRTEQAAFEREAAAAELLTSRRETERLARTAYRSVTLGVARIRAFERAWESVQTNLEANQAGLKAGTRDTVDVVDATSRLYTAERELLQARYDYLMDTLHLRLASGQLGR